MGVSPDRLLSIAGELRRFSRLGWTLSYSLDACRRSLFGWSQEIEAAIEQGGAYAGGRLAPDGDAATFTEAVKAGADYLLVDDHVGFGSTLANLRGHIEANGGHVLAMTALTDRRGEKLPFAPKRFLCYTPNMETISTHSGASPSATVSTASPTLRPDTYVVSNPLTPSELDWLRQQSEYVGEVYRQSKSKRAAQAVPR